MTTKIAQQDLAFAFNLGMKRIIVASTVLLPLFFLTAGCASTDGAAPYVAPLSIRPVSRFVRPTDPKDLNDRIASSDRYVDSVRAGTPIFDQYRRKPGYGIDATDVDCQNVDRIGITFFLDKTELSAGARKTKLTLYVEWHMPDIGDGKSIVDYYEGPVFFSLFPHKTYEEAYVTGLLFTNREPRNGVYKVFVSYRGRELYRDSFNFVDCD